MTAQSAVNAALRSGASILKVAGRWCRAGLGELVRALLERDARYRASRHLARLEDHLLRDIGLTRDAVRGRRPSEWFERDARHRAPRQLTRLEEHLLRDIGLNREAVRGRRP